MKPPVYISNNVHAMRPLLLLTILVPLARPGLHKLKKDTHFLPVIYLAQASAAPQSWNQLGNPLSAVQGREARWSPAHEWGARWNKVNSGHRQQDESEDSQNSLDQENNEFAARCLIQREPSWSEDPSLYYFSTKRRSSSTLGCTADLELKIDISKAIEHLNREEEGKAEDEDNSREPFSGLSAKSYEESRGALLKSYNSSWATFVLIHGFMADWASDNWMCQVKDMILNNSQANVFIVDWSGGSKPMLPIDYGQAVVNTKYMGHALGVFVKWLLWISRQADAGRFHLVGHSLGAHISGFVGYSLGGSLGRITGLDPAGPCFRFSLGTGSGGGPSSLISLPINSNSNNNERSAYLLATETGYLEPGSAGSRRRLSPASARLVVALHTDTSLFGLDENCAHFNVYVNGGSNQPSCTNLSVGDRLKKLLQLNLAEAFDWEIVCAHSYAHKIVDSISKPFDRALSSSSLSSHEGKTRFSNKFEQGRTKGVEEQSYCFPMSYKCRSWEAFKAGECGYCREGSRNCIFIGFTLNRPAGKDYLNASIHHYDEIVPSSESSDDVLNDDGTFNDEDSDHTEDDGRSDKKDDGRKPADMLANAVSRGQHFIKLGEESPTCLFHYQLIVATNSSRLQKVDSKIHYYLQIPLASREGRLTNSTSGQRLRDRLVQVSHRLGPEAWAHQLISGEFLHDMKAGHPKQRQLISAPESLEYYTALITFRVGSSEECGNNWQGEPKSNLHLCHPVRKMREARLWSSSEVNLEAVKWVAVNYMSGLQANVRSSFSQLFETNSRIRERQELKVKGRGSFSQTEVNLAPSKEEISREPTSSSSGTSSAGPLGQLVAGAPIIDCLTSSLPIVAGGSSSSSNFKCSRSNSELKYSVKLSPMEATTRTTGQTGRAA